jgi:PhnB protein
MEIQPYLFFEGRCEEAIEFYRSAVGAELVMLMRRKDGPPPEMPGTLPPNAGEKVLHATFRIGSSTIMASDGLCSGKPNFQGFSLSIGVANDAEAQRVFNALAQGGKVTQPLAKTFFASSFGMLHDRFGVAWMVSTQSA